MLVFRYPNTDAATKALCACVQSKGKVVFDLDDTLFHLSEGRFFRVDAMYALYCHVRKLGCEIYLVSARNATPQNMRQTRDLLHCMGYTSFTRLCLMPRKPGISRDKEVFAREVALFKSQMRAEIGYPILLNVGNQWQDLLDETDITEAVESMHTEVYVFCSRNVRCCVKLPRRAQKT